jgi:hypothetical protein
MSLANGLRRYTSILLVRFFTDFSSAYQGWHAVGITSVFRPDNKNTYQLMLLATFYDVR